jgi:hypothetical protein
VYVHIQTPADDIATLQGYSTYGYFFVEESNQTGEHFFAKIRINNINTRSQAIRMAAEAGTVQKGAELCARRSAAAALRSSNSDSVGTVPTEPQSRLESTYTYAQTDELPPSPSTGLRTRER